MGKKVTSLRIDNGMGFCSRQYSQFCKDEGIVRHRTVQKASQQNGVAKKMSRTLFERADACSLMLICQRSFGQGQSTQLRYLINEFPFTSIGLQGRNGMVPLENIWLSCLFPY